MRPRANVRILITGEGLDLDAITEALGVEPTYTRLGETYDDWEYTIPRAECASVSERIGALEAVFGDRTGQISAVRERYAANVSVGLSLHAVIGDEPDLTLTRGDLAFLGAMGAEFGIDPYPYYPDETDDLPPVGEGA